uniref:DUF7773 domain-containing protein n=1 Tax=Globodera rostochiensis TaxID=31243 RepID=A0A914HY09_GLORO
MPSPFHTVRPLTAPPLLLLSLPAVNPSRENICGPEEICFGEYYSLHQSAPTNPANDESLSHYFDRFCVHRQHCVSRGLWPEERACLHLNELDAAVAQTFRNKLISERLDPSRLFNTRFCCCSDNNLCNRMDASEIGKLFNVTITVPQHQTPIHREGTGRYGLGKNLAIKFEHLVAKLKGRSVPEEFRFFSLAFFNCAINSFRASLLFLPSSLSSAAIDKASEEAASPAMALTSDGNGINFRWVITSNGINFRWVITSNGINFRWVITSNGINFRWVITSNGINFRWVITSNGINFRWVITSNGINFRWVITSNGINFRWVITSNGINFRWVITSNGINFRWVITSNGINFR